MRKEGEVRIPAGCAIAAVISREGTSMPGDGIASAMRTMHDRSNGLGGGFAGYGIYPEYADFYALHCFFDGRSTRKEREAYLQARFELVHSERIPTRTIPEITDEPVIWRFFVSPLRSVLAELQAEGPAKEEKKTRRGRRGGRGRKAQTERAPAEATEKPEAAESAVKTAAPEKTETQEKPAGKAAEKPAAKAPEKKAEKPEDKPAPVQNKAVPSEPAKVTVTVHDVPMVTHAVAPQKPEESAAVSRVQAALAESKTDAAVALNVISIVQKHEGAKNSRQATYLEIRKTFGQKMGVDLYNRIKPLLR